ncbi:DUF1566 domain-containing protein [Vibrio sp. Of14-4]|uniref:Lcl C-terminal domain-containing protein n=1 Tax=Vibrio sp. Of14-4 TaxID=2724878 RepID=UPI001EF174EB|nr:DUF1566 domain-containing protein [Vibrio sp. Of14-4]
MKIVAQTFGIMACAAFIAGCGGGNESDPKLDATNLAANTTTDNVSSNNNPKFPAPEKMDILSTSDDNPIYGNMISWDDLSVSIWNSPVTFDQPEHYEYTTDGGSTWQTVVSKPQFIGPQAYAKNKVGIRVKQNALEGMPTPASETLFATSTSRGEFVALQFVPMDNINKVITFGDKGWDYTRANCVAEYNPDGSGEPIFWAKSQSYNRQTFDELSDKVSAMNACNIKGSRLIEVDAAKRLRSRTVDEKVRSFVINSFSGPLVAKRNGTLVSIKESGEGDISPDLSHQWFAVWSLPAGAQLVDEIDGAQITQKLRLSEQAARLQQARDAVVNLLSLLDDTEVDYTRLSADNAQYQTLLSSALASWQDIYSGHQPAITFFVQRALLAKNRSDSKSQEFVLKVDNYVSDWREYEYNVLVAAALLKELQAVDSLAKLHQQNSIIASSIAALDGTQDGKKQQIGANRLHKAFFTSQQLRAELTAWLESLPNLKSSGALALIDKYDLLSHYDKENIEQLIVAARERAQNSGAVVSQFQAIIVDAAGKQYAKLDKAGLYLAQNSTYEQGWRCVLELGSGDRRRIWMLLPKVEANTLDYFAYQGSSDESKNVLGPKGYISNVNQEALCGVSDWRVPTILQLQSLASRYVKYSEYSSDKGLSIDTDVFVNHPHNQPVYYWSAKPGKEGEQTAYVYASTSNSEESKSFPANNMAALVRLVSENTLPNQWQYLDVSGGLVENRAEASCAKNLMTGHVWQLFDKRGDTRWVDYEDLTENLDAQTSEQVCGLSNWRLPSVSELGNLIPVEQNVLIYNDVKDPFGTLIREQYFTDFSTQSTRSYFDFVLGEVKQVSLLNDRYLYRFIATP